MKTIRDIQFRGKRCDSGDWVSGDLIHSRCFYGQPENHSFICNNEHPQGCYGGDIYIDVTPETVGQFTGYADKNGVKIFEDDILLVDVESEHPDASKRHERHITKGVVIFENGEFMLDGKCLVLCTYYGVKRLFDAAQFKNYEVIGNIHDNPELLESEES